MSSADPQDGRRRVVLLTPRGTDCLRASAEIFDELLAEWRGTGAAVEDALDALGRLDALYGGPDGLRPVW
jgi:DNA-binding MarR family transcriptional regulator